MKENQQDICFACKRTKTLTSEHIIPQALGGKLEAFIYCKKCNGAFGETLDAELSKYFGYLGTILNIKRTRKKNQPFSLQDIKTGTELQFDGKKFQRKRPVVKLEKNGKKLTYANVAARSEKELKKITESISKTYSLGEPIKIESKFHKGPTETEHKTAFYTKLIGRGVAKIAYSFLCTKLPRDTILSNPFDCVRDYIAVGKGDDLAAVNFVNTKFMCDHVRPIHKIHIGLNRVEDFVVGYVIIFGVFRYTVLLADNFKSFFEWPGIDYTFNPTTSKEIPTKDNFRAPVIRHEDILKPKQSKEFVFSEISRGLKVIENHADGLEVLKIEPS